MPKYGMIYGDGKTTLSRRSEYSKMMQVDNRLTAPPDGVKILSTNNMSTQTDNITIKEHNPTKLKRTIHPTQEWVDDYWKIPQKSDNH